MVLALSGSRTGRQYLSQQSGLLLDLLSLLHTGSARVQRQVTALLRRVLPEIPPSLLASLLKVKRLPSVDLVSSSDDPFNPLDPGVLDVFLACIAKALTVQTKVKGRTSNVPKNVPGEKIPSRGVVSVTLGTAIHPREKMERRWWLRGRMSRKLAEEMMSVIREMSTGKVSEEWMRVTRGAISDSIINLTRIPETDRVSGTCFKSPTLWIALAALCLLDTDLADRLSSSSRWMRMTVSGTLPPNSAGSSSGSGSGDQAVPQPSRVIFWVSFPLFLFLL